MLFDSKNYIKECENAVDTLIERATRFGAQDTLFKSQNANLNTFKICVKHQLEVDSNAQVVVGNAPANNNDWATYDPDLYQQEVKKQCQDELHGHETLDELASSVTAISYASINTRTHLRTHQRRLFYHYTCGNCNGYGNVSCHACYGSGQQTCHQCSGSGQQTSTHQERDSNGNYIMKTQYYACYGCGGSGKKNCNYCGGSGNETCQSCSGMGEMTEITETETFTNPSFSAVFAEQAPNYLNDAIHQLGFAALETHGEIHFNEYYARPELGQVEFFYTCQVPSCELDVEINKIKRQWVMVGENPLTHRADGALEALLVNDQAALVALNQGAACWRPNFYKQAAPVLKDFMASEIHQDMLNSAVKHNQAAAISTVLRNTVTEPYVKQSLDSVSAAHRTLFYWSAAKLASAIILIAPLLFLGYLCLFSPAFMSEVNQISAKKIVASVNSISYLLPFLAILLSVSVLAYFINKWVHFRWLKKTGGQALVDWSKNNGKILGKISTQKAKKWIAGIAACLAFQLTGLVLEYFPIWAENSKVFGLIPLAMPEETVAQPASVQAAEVLPQSSKKRNH